MYAVHISYTSLQLRLAIDYGLDTRWIRVSHYCDQKVLLWRKEIRSNKNRKFPLALSSFSLFWKFFKILKFNISCPIDRIDLKLGHSSSFDVLNRQVTSKWKFWKRWLRDLNPQVCFFENWRKRRCSVLNSQNEPDHRTKCDPMAKCCPTNALNMWRPDSIDYRTEQGGQVCIFENWRKFKILFLAI